MVQLHLGGQMQEDFRRKTHIIDYQDFLKKGQYLDSAHRENLDKIVLQMKDAFDKWKKENKFDKFVI